MESFLYEKLEKAKRDRQTNFEVLGQCMIDSGNDFGPGTSYGEYTLLFYTLNTVQVNPFMVRVLFS